MDAKVLAGDSHTRRVTYVVQVGECITRRLRTIRTDGQFIQMKDIHVQEVNVEW